MFSRANAIDLFCAPAIIQVYQKFVSRLGSTREWFVDSAFIL